MDCTAIMRACSVYSVMATILYYIQHKFQHYHPVWVSVQAKFPLGVMVYGSVCASGLEILFQYGQHE